MDENYVYIGTKHINSFGSASQFWAYYYYKMYRQGTKMFYRLKADLKYVNTTGGTGYYQDKVNVNFKINYDQTNKYDAIKTIKDTTYGNFVNNQSWSVESDWFDFEKTSGKTKCQININNAVTSGFDSPNYEFELDIINALSTMTIDVDDVYFTIDQAEGVSNTVPVTVKTYVDGYNQKLIAYYENVNSERVSWFIRNNFITGNLTFSESELNAIYNNITNSKIFKAIFVLETYEGITKIGETELIKQGQLSTDGLAPTLTTNFTEINPKVVALLGNSAETLIQNASIVNMEVTPTGHKGASIKQVQMIHNDIPKTKTESPYNHEFNVLNGVFYATVTDSRDISNESEYKYIKNLIEYLPVNINSYSFDREDMTSSNIILNADIQYKQATFGSTANVPTIKWKLNENGNWNTIASSNYTKDNSNNKIIITDLVLNDVLDYQNEGTMFLMVSDLLTEDNENEIVIKGIPTFEAGEHDFQVNGELFLADINRENIKNIIDIMHPVNSLMFTMDDVSPSTYIVGTTWEKIAKGKTLVGVDENDEDFNESGKTGGGKEIQIPMQIYDDFLDFKRKQIQEIVGWENYRKQVAGTVLSLPNENCGEVIMGRNENSKDTNGNLQPYLTCYIWKRIS